MKVIDIEDHRPRAIVRAILDALEARPPGADARDAAGRDATGDHTTG